MGSLSNTNNFIESCHRQCLILEFLKLEKGKYRELNTGVSPTRTR